MVGSQIAAVLVAVLAYFIGCSQVPSFVGCRVYSVQDFKTWVPYIPHLFEPRGNEPFAAAAADSKRARFLEAFKDVRTELIGAFAAQGVPEDAQTWYARTIDYNVPGGKLNRGISVIDSVEIMKGRPLSKGEFSRPPCWDGPSSLYVSLQAFFLVMDDVMDKSITRRGQPCYYRVPGVGTISVNDAVLLESAIYQLLKAHFREDAYYVDLMELFHETTFQTSTGQLMDLITAPEDSVDLSKLSLEKFRLIALYKTAHYSFYLPVALAMLMCEIPQVYQSKSTSKPVHPYALARSILLPIGEYFQVQDDFLDFAADPAVLGKIGTDIVDNKCSWCINTALDAASPEQRAVLDANYGRRDAGMEDRVKAVFEEVGLREKYRAYEDKVHAEILSLIEAVPEEEGVSLKRQVFINFLDKIYKRQK
ncbi:farnesyl-diphosphate synthase [Mycena rosella]|uniref:(2E,6E)-farnesyl diphosphate synthase n=1 Tax=Mycena rosella TaxID=1033263 RepID=A0AAD7DBL6_MYCRO|nr:farnesyl-diphosphate synthase [Mycena rosella]